MTAASAPSRVRADAEDFGLPILLLSELALGLVTLAAVFGLRRAFLDTEWMGPLLLQAVGAHVLPALLRRRGVSLPASLLAQGGAALLAVTWIYAGDASAFGIPTGASIDALLTSVSDAAAVFGDVKAPTEALDGFLVATSVSLWLGAGLADWAGFRVDAPLEATLPSATLFVLTAVLGADVDRVLISAFWVLPVLAFVLLRRADRLGRTASWVGERRRLGPRTLLAVGGALLIGAVAVAAVVGPRIPGAESEAILSLTDIGDEGPGTRVTVSPLVDIRSRLVDQADVEVFSVRSPVRSYWRLTSLDRFDGRIWSSNGSYGTASGDLDDGVPVASETVTFDQSFAITALSQIWLPAAYEPQAVETATDVRYDEVSGTIIVDTDIPTSDNTTYLVRSALPEHDPAALAAASSSIPSDIAERYLDLPADFPDSVRALAADVTAGSGSTYEASRRLQDFFRNEFTYDLDVGNGHSEDAIEQFVLELRRGYCEQFAGSFAAMARSLGIPARVAVGFTPGISDPDDPTLYRVRGEHAHAWPEVFIGEYGWVLFEPTPGRGAPFAEQYTGVPEQQVSSGTGGTTATTTVSPPSTAAPTGEESPATSAPGDFGDLGTGDLGTGAEEPGPASPWLGRFAWAAGIFLVGLALYLTTVLLVASVRRARRHRGAVDPAAKIALAWDESLDAVRRAGVPVRPSETETEAAERIGARLPSAGPLLADLAGTVHRSTYSGIDPGVDDGDGALVTATQIERVARESMSNGERVVATFHPSRLLR